MPIDGTVSHALERMLAYAAQTEGFYTGWLMTEDFARNEIENYLFFAVNHLEVAAANAAAAQGNAENLQQLMFYPVTPQTLYQYFTQLTTIQILKYFLQSRISPKFWFIFKPFKNLLSKLGFKV